MSDFEQQIRDSQPDARSLPALDVAGLVRRARRRTLAARASGTVAALAILAGAAVLVGGLSAPDAVEFEPAAPAADSPDEPGEPDEPDEPTGEELIELARLTSLDIRERVGLEDSDQALMVARAEAVLVTECLQEAGIDHTMPDPAEFRAGPAQDLPGDEELWLRVSDTFGVADRFADPAVRERLAGGGERPTQPTPPEGFEEAYRGDPPETITVETHAGDVGEINVGGCRGEAVGRLHDADPAEYERTRLALLPLTDLHRTVVEEPEVAAVTEDWAQCMRDRGHDLSSPDELTVPLGDALEPVIERGDDLGELRRLEAALASDDRDCKGDSGLREAYAQAFVDEARRALSDLEGPLADHRRMLDHAVEMSERLVTD